MSENAGSDYDRSIHSNPDAMAWAKFFVKTIAENKTTIEQLDESVMVGWFANAMMAMHDSMNTREQGRADALEEAAKLCDSYIWGGIRPLRAELGAAIRALASRPAQPERPALAFPEEFANKVSAIYRATAQPAPGTVNDTGNPGNGRYVCGGCGESWPVLDAIPPSHFQSCKPLAGTGEPERTAAQERELGVSFLHRVSERAVSEEAKRAYQWAADAINEGDHISDQAQRSGGDRG